MSSKAGKRAYMGRKRTPYRPGTGGAHADEWTSDTRALELSWSKLEDDKARTPAKLKTRGWTRTKKPNITYKIEACKAVCSEAVVDIVSTKQGDGSQSR